MKLRLAVWGIFLALCVTPAFADLLHFTNKGLISGGGSNSGINIVSCLTKVSLDGSVILSGHVGSIAFDTGNFAGACWAAAPSIAAPSVLTSTASVRFCSRTISPGRGRRSPTTCSSWWELSPRPWMA